MSNAAPDLDSLTSDEFLDKLLTLPAVIDHDSMREIEGGIQNPAHRINRRCLLALMTQDNEALFELAESDFEGFFDGYRCMAQTLGMYKRLIRLLDIGHNRMMLALFGVDTDDPDAPFSKKDFDAAMEDAKGEPIKDSSD